MSIANMDLYLKKTSKFNNFKFALFGGTLQELNKIAKIMNPLG
jgi:hypothetical protein